MKCWPTLKCSSCGGILPNRDVRPGVPLVCPRCSRQLQPSQSQLRLSGLIAFGLTLVLCRFLGLRGLWLFGATILFWFPAYVVWDFVFVRVVPPKFETYVPKKSKDSDSKLDLFSR
jgi:hypothetical protein